MMWLASLLLVLKFVAFLTLGEVAQDGNLETFQKLFMAKRVEQLAAVKNVLKLEDDKMKIFLDQITLKLFQVLASSHADKNLKFQMDESGKISEKASLILENVCLASDLLLRLPDQMSKLLKETKERQEVFKWAVTSSIESNLLDESSLKLLNLASQEMGFVEKDPNYINPYKIPKKPAKRFEEPPPPKKKERKSLKKGPRMTRDEF